MRGFTVAADAFLQPNTSDAESSLSGFGYPTATGWSNVGDNTQFFTSTPYIYIAIRRGPMKTPTVGTEVFSALSAVGTGAATTITTGFVTDLFFRKCATSGFRWFVLDRLRNDAGLETQATTAEETGLSGLSSGLFAFNSGFFISSGGGSINDTFNTYSTYSFRRAPGFFDVVAYTGTGAGTVTHNLGVVPEMIICKSRSDAVNWAVYHSALGGTNYLRLNLTNASQSDGGPWNNTTPTSSVFSVGGDTPTSFSGLTYIAYLFATLTGVSKVGSYTGTGTTLDIDCGFTAGSRFVLIKRTDSTGDWFVWDTARGIISGDDPYLLLNSTAAEVTNTDYIDPLSSGFQISSTAPAAINASGGSFIFLAIA
jgi:hypothetical protein